MKPVEPIAALVARDLGPIRPTVVIARGVAMPQRCEHGCGSRMLTGTLCCHDSRAEQEGIRAARRRSRAKRQAKAVADTQGKVARTPIFAPPTAGWVSSDETRARGARGAS